MDDLKNKIINGLERIGNQLEAKITKRIKYYQPYPIKGTGEFQQSIFSNVLDKGDYILLEIGSSVPYAKYIYAGREKLRRWVPLDPILSWIENKPIRWYDKKGEPMPIKTMAFLIRRKIYLKGIEPKPVIEDIVREELDSIMIQIEEIINNYGR